MPRRPEDIFTRVARHVDLTAEELRTFLDCGDTCCLIWKGMVKPKARTKKHAPRPHLDKIGSPVRPLFAYTRAVEKLDSLVQLRNACGNNLCINPQHYNPKGVFNLFQYRRGVVPTLPDPMVIHAENVEYALEQLRSGTPYEEFRDYLSDDEFEEALRRYKGDA